VSSPVAAGGLVGIPAVTYRNGGTERASRIEFWYFLSPDPEITRDDNELAGGATISNLPPARSSSGAPARSASPRSRRNGAALRPPVSPLGSSL
jgi:hypothetical protein